ncbi:MAG: hypothetical protein U0271_17095 [Polyangiaceae bacterium]
MEPRRLRRRSSLRFAALLAALLALLVGAPRTASAAPTPDSELVQGQRELEVARAAANEADRRASASLALKHFQVSHGLEPRWQAAAGACDAALELGLTALASGWYWLATDAADYKDEYIAWQTDVLARLFDKRVAVAFDYDKTPASLRVDGAALPDGAFTRPLALDPGDHPVAATAETGATYEATVTVTAAELGTRQFHHVIFKRILRAGEVDPNDVQLGPRPPDPPPMSALQIVTIVATGSLATAIAIGGGYLLFGRDNPNGIDTPEGAAIIGSELLLIGVGIAVALIN